MTRSVRFLTDGALALPEGAHAESPYAYRPSRHRRSSIVRPATELARRVQSRPRGKHPPPGCRRSIARGARRLGLPLRTRNRWGVRPGARLRHTAARTRPARRRTPPNEDEPLRLHHDQSAAVAHHTPDRPGSDHRHPDGALLRDHRAVASDLGYDVDFVTDATATFPIPDPAAATDRDWDVVRADPRTLSTDAVIERTEYALAGRFATIRRTSDLVAA